MKWLLLTAVIFAACNDGPAPTSDVGLLETGVDSGSEDIGFVEAPLSWDFEEAGPYRIGHRSFPVEYQPMTAVSRAINVHVWYPTEDEEGQTTKYRTIIDQGTFENATIAASAFRDGTYPVHLHSHGRQGYGGASVDVLRYFVSHGWVAVAPDHTGDTIFDAQMPLSVPVYAYRLLDLKVSLDELEALPMDDPLSGKLRTSSVLLSGHSLGAFLAWGAAGVPFAPRDVAARCADVDADAEEPCGAEPFAPFENVSEPRVAAVIPMAGVLRTEWYEDDGHTAVEVPVLTLTGSEDPVGQQEQWDRIIGIDHTWIDFAGVCHHLFSVGTCSQVPRADGLAAVNAYALGFGRRHILADDGEDVRSLLSGERRLANDLVGTFRASPP